MKQHEDKPARKQYDKDKKVAIAEKGNRDHAVRELLKTPAGRDYLWWLITISYVESSPHNVASDRATSYNCGKQDLGREIRANIIEVSVDGYMLMMKEKYDAQNAANAQSANDPEGSGGGNGSGDDTGYWDGN